ncbi:LOW QUALITY PROTEIN: hypothetical protein Cgig2_020986 [Carnegiea gigantea]|uniref:Uncharacterized protein n=1 Tax=Carnegiea gigantea TaxID=171969 RepID=A0A9Q1Q6H3_9CARY|nr:LOW QUALITY PROTEIN: hypothetical protein Cgig2_020986 [Carnegiea gigantea]
MVDIQPMNKEQEGPVALINADSNLAKKPEIKIIGCYLKDYLIANLNDEKKQDVNEIGLSVANAYNTKQVNYVLPNFGICCCSLLLAYGNMSMTKEDVDLTLCLLKGLLELLNRKMKLMGNSDPIMITSLSMGNYSVEPKSSRYMERMTSKEILSYSSCLHLDWVVFKLRLVHYQFLTLKGWLNKEMKLKKEDEFEVGFGKGGRDNPLDITKVIYEEQEREQRNRSSEPDAKAKEEIGVSKVISHDIIKKVVAWSTYPTQKDKKSSSGNKSDALIKGKSKKSKCTSLVFLPNSFE